MAKNAIPAAAAAAGVLTFIMVFAVVVVGMAAVPLTPPSTCFQRIFAFGDSLTDTGNAIRTSSLYHVATRLPYGETYFHHATGRFSDGRIVLDFLCQALGRPFVRAHLELPQHFLQGDNFAIAGTTALNTTFLKQTNAASFTPLSLEDEIVWFKDAKLRTFYEESIDFMRRSLVFFGEIGGNDYGYLFLAGQPVDRVLLYTKIIQQQIRKSLLELVEEGAEYIIVHGNFPMGCLPSYARMSTPGIAPQDRDAYGCSKAINQLSTLHNSLLKDIIAELQSNCSRCVQFVYFDAENAFLEVLKNPSKYGFTNTTGQCFDSGVSFNPNQPNNSMRIPSINTNVHACPDPSEYISWDGVHLTERMYKVLVELFLAGGFSQPQQNFLTHMCKFSFIDF